jgi:four helix bundle protein
MAQEVKLFRLEDFDVWQRAAQLAITIGNVADELEKLHRYRYAKQLRSAGLSISNNIAEDRAAHRRMSFETFSTMLGAQHSSAQVCC